MMERLMPIAGAEHAVALDAVLRSVHVHMAIQALAWGAFFLFCLVRFRHRANPTASHAGVRPLIAILAISAVIVGDVVLLATSALPPWMARSTPPSMPAPLEIHVIAEQFAWNIHYPGPDRQFGRTSPAFISASNPVGIDRTDPNARDDIGILNILTVPIGRPVILHLTARDVIHSFTLNEMRIKQDATPGMTVRTWFTPTVVGKWDIGCSQLCGLGHYRMRGDFSVVTPEEWDRWQQSEVALVTPRVASR
jgi:cytochrome c oxidase subunit II